MTGKILFLQILKKNKEIEMKNKMRLSILIFWMLSTASTSWCFQQADSIKFVTKSQAVPAGTKFPIEVEVKNTQNDTAFSNQ